MSPRRSRPIAAVAELPAAPEATRDQILVECCITSNYQTNAVKRGERHPIYTFLEHGVPVAICTDNTTVSNTDQCRENALVLDELSLDEISGLAWRADDRLAAVHDEDGLVFTLDP